MTRQRIRLSDAQWGDIFDRYDAGDRVIDIADDYGISAAGIYYRLNGRTRNPAPRPTRTPAVPVAREPQQQGPRLNLPTFEDQPWADRALCAQTDPEAFFPEKGGSTREAKRVCMACPVRTECLQYALDHQEKFGIWGGTSEKERRQLTRARDHRVCARADCNDHLPAAAPQQQRYCSQSCATNARRESDVQYHRRHREGVA